uniref:Uncharacterized protein n=1 Tax=Spironucleus salmonicida TaxID=348837 RepID=V6LT36_9EUKA|eukprot:EST46856.1 Hypothetical protein SS50377_13119 [Spironucleus salmonicida]
MNIYFRQRPDSFDEFGKLAYLVMTKVNIAVIEICQHGQAKQALAFLYISFTCPSQGLRCTKQSRTAQSLKLRQMMQISTKTLAEPSTQEYV